MSCANSEVSPVVRLVAVADRTTPAGMPRRESRSIVALPLASVVTWVEPNAVCPWPYPHGSAVGLVKNWIRKVVLGTLFSVPWMWVSEPFEVTVGQDRVILEVVGPVRLRSIGRDAVGGSPARPDRFRAGRWRRCCWTGCCRPCPTRPDPGR